MVNVENNNVERTQISIAFYEGSYQYTAFLAYLPEDKVDMFNYAVEQLDKQFRYRATDESLWCSIGDKENNHRFRLTRISNGVAKVWDMVEDVKYNFMALSYYNDLEIIPGTRY